MEPSRSERRSSISISSYVSSQRPALPARFESLNDDTLTTILQFVGNKSYATYAGINKHCKEIYLKTKGMTKKTFLFGYGSLFRITNEIERSDIMVYNLLLALVVGKGVVLYNRGDVLDWALQERKTNLLRAICDVAAEEGRIDILNEVLINVYGHGNTAIHRDVDVYAARGGKVNVLEWLENKGLSFRKGWCVEEAARHGHLHILMWLREERGVELGGYLYDYAIDGDHLHVMKWLKEKACPWGEYAFPYAAKVGNLEILQWLHDEGCPWPDDDDEFCVCEEDLKSEAKDWLSVNGYGDRIRND